MDSEPAGSVGGVGGLEDNLIPRSFPQRLGGGKALGMGTRLGEGFLKQRIVVETS